MAYIINDNKHEILRNNATTDVDYNRLMENTLINYVDAIKERMPVDLSEYDGDDFDWRDVTREAVVNTTVKTEDDFMDALEDIWRLSPIKTQRIIMAMTKCVIDYTVSNYGSDAIDSSVFSDIGKLYALWIYHVTSEVDFEYRKMIK
jgi:hypothetical protein